jgi:hypothetical protein
MKNEYHANTEISSIEVAFLKTEFLQLILRERSRASVSVPIESAPHFCLLVVCGFFPRDESAV